MDSKGETDFGQAAGGINQEWYNTSDMDVWQDKDETV